MTEKSSTSTRTIGLILVGSIFVVLIFTGALLFVLSRIMPPFTFGNFASGEMQTSTAESNREATAVAQNLGVGRPEGWQPVLVDDFTDAQYAWALSTGQFGEGDFASNIIDGKLRWSINGEPETRFFSLLPDENGVSDIQLSDAYMAVDISAPDLVRTGLMFRHQDGSAYVYEINAMGVWSVVLIDDQGNRLVLSQPKRTPVANRDSSNRMAVLAEGNRFSLYYNGTLLDTIINSSLKNGQWGLIIVIMPESQGARIEFDNFELYTPSNP